VKALHIDKVEERTFTVNLDRLEEGFYHVWIVSPGRKTVVRKLMVGRI
jgi:hypothetical protein